MTVIIIPGFTGYPEEVTFKGLDKILSQQSHAVVKIAWPYFPKELDKYCFTNTITYVRNKLERMKSDDLIILGFSMGGIIATMLATEFLVKKLGLIVSPYQAGSEDDLGGKYRDWKKTGYRIVNSSKFGALNIPFSFIEDARKYNALQLISQVSCPKLFIAGERDMKIPLKVSKKLFDLANEPKEWHQIPGMEHKYQYQPEMLDIVNKIIINFIGSKN